MLAHTHAVADTAVDALRGPAHPDLFMTRWTEDRTSGSSDVAGVFLAELQRWATVDTSTSVPALRQSLLAELRRAQSAQPSLALVHQLAARALSVVDAGLGRGDRLVDLRTHLAESCGAESADLVAARQAIACSAAALVAQPGSWIATLSGSTAVRDALLEAQRQGRAPRVLLAESRPRLEGRALASALAQAGITVWLVVDAALPLLISQAQGLWLGADAVTDQGVLNKVGSYAAALAAREHSVPVYALAERRKFLPSNTAALKIVEMPQAEIWESAPEGVQPRNVYFELVPLTLLRGVIVEDAVLPPGEAAALARERPLPEELARG